MSPKSKNKPTLNGRSCLFLISLIVFLVGCRTSRTKDYFHPDFKCISSPGWSDEQNFKKYRTDFWLPNRLIFQKENTIIKHAKVVIVGNSLVQLFLPEQMKREFPGVNIVNRGIGGDMTETLLERIDEDVLVLTPSTIIIEIGGNDLIYKKCLSLIQNNIQLIVKKILKSNPSMKIIFIAAPPTRVSELNRIVPVYNLFLSDFARKTKNVTYLEVWDEMRKADEPSLKDEFFRPFGDTIHFNEKGYEVWSRKLRPLL